MALKGLPFDVYVHILKQLPPSTHSDEAPKTLVACLQANSILRSAASVGIVWEPHYHARYTISLPASERSRKQTLGEDWKSLYMERIRLDRLAIKILDDIVMERDGRLERAREMTTTLSYDVWNALAAEAQCPIPEPFRHIEDDNEGNVPNHAIPRRFWARSLLGSIARSHAVRTWGRVKDDPDDPDTLETAFACLSSYFAHPPKEISFLLDDLCDHCRSYLAGKNISTVPHEFNRSEGSLSRISTSICDFLWEYGYRAAEHSRFNAFGTRFPHWFLTTHRDTIPISLVYIFVCLARRLGIKAAPVDFPARVLAIVSSPEPSVAEIIVDVFGSRNKPVLSVEEDIPRLLMDTGIAPSRVVRYIQPGSTASMVIRASRNILASFSFLRPPIESVSEGDLHTAFYVGLTVNLIFMNDRRYLLNIMKHIAHFPLDILSVLTDALAPILTPPIQEQLLASCKAAHEDEDEAAATVTLRSKPSTRIKHFVGMIFRHAKYEYVGYIYGWEPSCMASEGWIASMNVDSLPRGRHQPFYHIFTQSGSVRYVAEENVKPTALQPYAYRQLLQSAPEAGRYFEGLVEANERARLLLSPELLSAYPEDDAVGDKWIREGKTE